jgi:light-regulated signal transduction histidine kinase (bacteriophytochrome)
MPPSPLKKPRSASIPGPEDREDSFQPLLERYHSLHHKFLESQQVFQSLKAQFDKISVATRRAVIESPQDIGRSSRNLQGELQKGGEASTQLADCVHELTKELEETNLKLSQEMSARAGAEETIRRRTEELLRSNEDLERFAYMASHDLKEPLRTVSAFTKLLAKRYRGRLDDDADDFMQYMLDGIGRMEQLITDVLVYCRVGSGEIALRRTDLNEVVDRAVENLKEAIQESHAQVGHARLPVVLGNESELLQIFQNLLGNAIKFHGPEPPVVTISAERRESEWVLAVEDNGIGIEPRYAGKIFELFTRLNTVADYPGSGIGLATCKKAVEHHGGRIFLKPQSNGGATFYFTLPCP